MLFPSVGGYMLKKYPMAAIWYSRSIMIKLNLKFNTNKKMLFPSVGGYMLKNTETKSYFHA